MPQFKSLLTFKLKLLPTALLAATVLLAMPFCSASSAADDTEILNQAWEAYNLGHYKQTLSLLQPLASNGNAKAQVLVGRCYENGLGVAPDAAEAVKWYELAVEKGSTEAMILLAYCHSVGAGAARDEQRVATLMTRAAQAGNPEAQFNLAMYHLNGQYGFDKEPSEIFSWAKQAADSGYAQAQRLVGACYEFGLGVEKNDAEARKWYDLAAANGLPRDGHIFGRIITRP